MSKKPRYFFLHKNKTLISVKVIFSGFSKSSPT